MNDPTSTIEPAWGSLPIEQYLIQRWDALSPLTTAEQRTNLIRDFIEEDDIGPDLDPSQAGGVLPRIPTPEEIATILQPWRPQRLRSIATRHWEGKLPESSFCFLRTYYAGGEDDDAKVREWLDMDPCDGGCDMSPDDEWWQVLSDSDLFNVDDDEVWDDWRQVYDLLPELAAPTRNRRFTEQDVDYVLETVAIRAPGDEAIEDDYEDAIMEAAACGKWLLVLDRLAFETGELRLIFRDQKGHVVKEGGIDAEDLGHLITYSFRGAVSESPWWLDAGVGKRYKPRGRTMKALMKVVRSKLPERQ